MLALGAREDPGTKAQSRYGKRCGPSLSDGGCFGFRYRGLKATATGRRRYAAVLLGQIEQPAAAHAKHRLVQLQQTQHLDGEGLGATAAASAFDGGVGIFAHGRRRAEM